MDLISLVLTNSVMTASITKIDMSLYSLSVILIFLSCSNNGYSKISDVEADPGHRIGKRETGGRGGDLLFDRNKKLTVVNANYFGQKIADVIPKLPKKWDILFLSEINAISKSRQVIQNYSYPDNPNLWGFSLTETDSFARVILFKSKLNIVIHSVDKYKVPTNQGDETKERYGISVDLNIGNLNLALLNVHLSWGSSGFADTGNINFIEDTLEFFQGKNFVFGGAFNTKASLVKDKVRSTGNDIFPVDLITVWDSYGWACSDYLISNLNIIDKDLEESFVGQHNTVWVTYEIPKVEKYNSNNFAKGNVKFKNSL